MTFSLKPVAEWRQLFGSYHMFSRQNDTGSRADTVQYWEILVAVVALKGL